MLALAVHLATLVSLTRAAVRSGLEMCPRVLAGVVLLRSQVENKRVLVNHSATVVCALVRRRAQRSPVITFEWNAAGRSTQSGREVRGSSGPPQRWT